MVRGIFLSIAHCGKPEVRFWEALTGCAWFGNCSDSAQCANPHSSETLLNRAGTVAAPDWGPAIQLEAQLPGHRERYRSK